MRVGMSVGTPDEAAEARGADADYWSAGPLHSTGTKADAGAALGLEGVRRLADLAPPGLPVIAIGGVTPEDVAPLRDIGCWGVAVVSGIFGSDSVTAAAKRYRDALDGAP
jgi:thiamine-phosphate diphosphorylase